MRPEIIQSIPTRSAAVAGVVTGVALTAALILIPMPANAGSIDGRNDAALAGVTPNASVHVLSGTLEMRAEQRQRSGGQLGDREGPRPADHEVGLPIGGGHVANERHRGR